MTNPLSHVGPPRLIDFSCRIREPDSGNAACLLTFEVEKSDPTSRNDGSTSRIDLEMLPSTLSILLEGLGRIRDQLSTVTNKK